MTRIPYGYQMINGTMIISEKEAEQIRNLFETYISGASILQAGKKAGLSFSYRTINNILQNPVYIRNDAYPGILENDIYEKAQAERRKRWEKRKHRTTKPKQAQPVKNRFVFHEERLSSLHPDDPQKLISALYDCIESSDYGMKAISTEQQNRIREWLKNQTEKRSE